MKHNLFTITALSAAMLAGFAHADDAEVSDASGSKTYTFDFNKTIEGTLSLEIMNNGSAVETEQQYEYVMGAPSVNIQGDYTPPGPSLYSIILKDHIISSNTNESFTLQFRNSKPMTFDDGTGDVVNCLVGGATSCGNVHNVWIPGQAVHTITNGDYNVYNVYSGQDIPGFYIAHYFSNPQDNFSTGTYSEQWKLTITPGI